MTLRTYSLSIEAPASRVWAVVSGLASWPDLTPSINSLVAVGDWGIIPGNKFLIDQPKLRRAVWTVTDVRPGRFFAWESGGAGVRTRGTHEVTEGPGGAVVTLTIEQRGLLGPVVGALAGSLTERYLELEAAGFKERSEHPVAS